MIEGEFIMNPNIAIMAQPHASAHRCETYLKGETTEQRLSRLADCGPAAIDDRLAELDREWSAGRATKGMLGVVTLIGMGLGLSLGGWWYILPVVAGLFLLQYLFSRTSWMGRVFHEAGLRSGHEIEEEKFALKILRGDFCNLPTVHDIEDRDAVSRLEGEGGPAVEFETEKVDSRDAAKQLLHATRS